MYLFGGSKNFVEKKKRKKIIARINFRKLIESKTEDNSLYFANLRGKKSRNLVKKIK